MTIRTAILISFLVISITAGVPLHANGPLVRIKDIAKILEARDNQLMGFGLVVGLRNTGDTAQTQFTQIALSNLLNNMDIKSVDEQSFKSRNVAAVMITADLPPFLRSGQRIDVVVSSVGDARSLQGGTLLLTPLKGADGGTYAVAQGPVAVGGINEIASDASLSRNQPTVGRISGGAIIEKEVSIQIADKNYLSIVLNKPDFTTAARIAYAINATRIAECKAEDATTVRVRLDEDAKTNIVNFIAKIEEISVNPDTVAKVVVSERTGTVVIGENVRLNPVAVTHGNISVRIEKSDTYDRTEIKLYEKPSKLMRVEPGSTLASLVDALNAVGTSPRDLIAVLQAIKEAGALSADLEII